METTYEMKTGKVEPDVAPAQLDMYKTFYKGKIINAPCPNCGGKIGRHGIVCEKCLNALVTASLNDPSAIDLDKIINDAIAQQYEIIIINEEKERRQNEKSSN